MSKKSKYTRVEGWDDSEGFLTSEQIEILKADEKANQSNEGDSSEWEELQIISDEVIDLITEHMPRHKVSEEYKNTQIFLLDKPEHPLGNDGLKRVYANLKDIEIYPEDLDSIK